MLFDRYRSKKPTPTNNEKKKSNLASALFKRLVSSSLQKNKKPPVVISQPRSSVSLPNIPSSTTISPPPPPPPLSQPRTNAKTRQRKRHSAEQRRHRHHLVAAQDVNRHSLTFGHLPPNKNKKLTVAELSFSVEQLKKLSKLSNLQDNTDALLNQLGSKQPPVLVPHRSISHQHLHSPIQLQQQSLNRTHSESHVKMIEIEADPIEPEALLELLEAEQEGHGSSVTLIDVRNLVEYQKCRIRGSLNVNLPSLLIKRYQRGSVSNFNLENFITTSEGRDIYASKRQKTQKFNTILEQKAMEAEQKKNANAIWVVFDSDMSRNDQTSQAWTLLGVLERFVGAGKNSQGQVYYLRGGYQSFVQYEHWLESSISLPPSTLSLPSAGTSSTPFANKNIPRRSISYTIGESKTDLHKRTSLFSLDTHAARVNNANALARRAKRRSQQHIQDTSTIAFPSSSTTATTSDSPPADSNPSLNRVAEDEEILTAECSPRTESDMGFIISEIIPGFLFVGPEVETTAQADQLMKHRDIKRVLNMAEECQDEGLRDTGVAYHKISARDTLEMKNIELVMMEAVEYIEEAKKRHEPIYVHCKAGKSRSITAILAYLVTSEHWTLKKAYRHVIKARPNMSPNIGFISELMKMEARVHGRVSSFLESDWQSTALPSPEYVSESTRLEKAWRVA